MIEVPGTGGPRLLILGVALVLVACTDPTASPSPSASPAPAPSASPSAAPTAAGTAPPTSAPSSSTLATPTPTPITELSFAAPFDEGWANKFVMRVTVSDLNVRDSPSTSAPSNGTAPNGGLFLVRDWPVTANGFTWYYGVTLLTSVPGVVPDLPTSIDTGYDEVLVGWMVTGTEDAPYVIPIAPRCPAVRDVRNLAAMLDSELVACFGSDSIELEGTFSCLDCFGEVFAGSFDPDWLANPRELYALSVDGEDALPLRVHFAPDGPALPEEGALIRVRGHFSDPRSATCEITVARSDGTTKSIADAAAEQWCRAKFVVERYEVIG